MIGNACEVVEALDVLAGSGPRDVRELTVFLATHGLLSVQVESQWAAAHQRVCQALDSGAAYEKFMELVSHQGGRLSEFDRSMARTPVVAPVGGWLHRFDCEKFGYAIIEMGGGRKQVADRLDHRSGIELLVQVGQQIEAGQPLLHLLDHPQPSPQVLRIIEQAMVIQPEPLRQTAGEAPWVLVTSSLA
jgi:thymidine phosphorylase